MILTIGDSKNFTAKDLGGKAYHLCKLKKLGFNVPNGFVITNKWFENPKKDQLLKYIEDNKLYAVRSSAVDEDGPNFSFAGLQDTYLNIEKKHIFDTVIKCYESQWSQRANSYREKYKLEKSKAMSVIIQEMVDADFAGVLFTQHPISNRIDEIAIDFIDGLGENLVSGLVTPSNYIVSKDDFKIKSKEINTSVLEFNQIEELCKTAIDIEKVYDSPQDIEWAYNNNKLYILQSRPITTTFNVPTSKLSGNRFYVSFGHIQNMTKPITPIGHEMIKSIFDFNKLLKFSDYVLYNGNYIYIDITELALMNNFIFKKVKLLVKNINIDLPELLDEFRKMEKRRNKAPIKLIPLLIPKLKEIIKYLNGKELDKKEIDALVKEHVNSYKNCSNLDELLSMRGDILSTTASVYLPLVATGLISYKKLKSLFEKWNLDSSDFHSLMSGLDGNITTEMGLLYGDLIDQYASVEGDKLLNKYLSLYGMRIEGEIDLGIERISESTSTFLEKVQADSLNKASITPRQRHEKHKEYSMEVKLKLKSQLSSRRWKKLKKYIDLMQNFMIYREHPKYIAMNIFQYYRPFIKTPFMTFDEEKNKSISDEVVLQRIIKHNNSIGKMPPLVILSNGQILQSNASSLSDGLIKGFGVSSGKLTGTARVIKEIGDSMLLENEILVTQFTDPGWTSTMARASGLVTEVGGLMTHGAVVAREYGIPAVVGVKNATTIIKTGDKISIDGSNGSIEIL